jgi:hypothetical protein
MGKVFFSTRNSMPLTDGLHELCVGTDWLVGAAATSTPVNNNGNGRGNTDKMLVRTAQSLLGDAAARYLTHPEFDHFRSPFTGPLLFGSTSAACAGVGTTLTLTALLQDILRESL